MEHRMRERTLIVTTRVFAEAETQERDRDARVREDGAVLPEPGDESGQ